MSIPDCLVVDTEAGTNELTPTYPSTWRRCLGSWEEWDLLEKDASSPDRAFKTVAIDTIDGLGGNQTSLLARDIVDSSRADLLAAFGSNGMGWALMTERMTRSLLRLGSAGYGIVATTHLRRKLITMESGATIQAVHRDLTPRIEGAVLELERIRGYPEPRDPSGPGVQDGHGGREDPGGRSRRLRNGPGPLPELLIGPLPVQVPGTPDGDDPKT